MADLGSLARRLGQTLKPGSPGASEGLFSLVKSNPQMASALEAANAALPRVQAGIPKKLWSQMDIQDLLQEAMAGVVANPNPSQIPQTVEQAMLQHIRKLRGTSPELGTEGFALPAQHVQAPQALEERMHKALLGGPGAKRPGITIPNAENVMAKLPEGMQKLVRKSMAGEQLSRQEAGLLAGGRQKAGLYIPGGKAIRGASKTKPSTPAPVRQATSPEEIEKVLAAHEALFKDDPRSAFTSAPFNVGETQTMLPPRKIKNIKRTAPKTPPAPAAWRLPIKEKK